MAKSSLRPRAAAPVRYRVSMPEPVSHELHVRMEVPALPERASVELVFPAWAPGSYLVRDFSRHIYDVSVRDAAGRPLAAARMDKLRWRVASEGRPFVVEYRVFAFEQSVRTSFLDESHAFWNGTSLFFFVEGELQRSCEVEVDVPRGWRVSTALPARRGEDVYCARSYDELADSPFEVGAHQLFAFRVRGVRFEVALTGRTNADMKRLLRELEKIVEAGAALFGGFPFQRYLFIIHALPSRGGGLEHAASTTLDIAGLSFEDEKGYQSFAELAAHEFFHVWNVKRIHDRVLGPFDYTRENYTHLLWFHEGFTEYMESILLLRAGLLPPERYVADLGEDWTRYVARPGRNVTPLSELSFEAWVKQYKPAENHINRMVSYYEKGKWAAVVLELLLRGATKGRAGLAELFRSLWESHGQPGVGITTEDVREAAEAIAGRSMARYFERYIDGTEELPVPAMLRQAGVRVVERTPWEAETDPVRARRSRAWIGVQLGPSNERATVKSVIPGSPAWRAGLTYGDEIIAVDGYRVSGSSASRRIADREPGDKIVVSYFRQELLRSATVTAEANPERKYTFSLDATAAVKARAVRRGWLGR